MKKKILKQESGFTLIEVISAAFIFAIVMILVGGMFVYFLNAQRRAINTQHVIENTNYIMESLAKEIRMATLIALPISDGCFVPSEDDPLEISHPSNAQIAGAGAGLSGRLNYYYDPADKSIHRKVTDETHDPNKTVDTILNSSTVKFTNLRFCISGIVAGDNIQPRITIMATIASTMAPDYKFNIQTTMSMRN
jgi:prepilin-type N-terminal cleavage/methylation domain-containing protein